MTKVYVCVYRHYFPTKAEVAATRLIAAKDPKLARFIDEYTNGTSYFDWGDDPSFYSAIHMQGRPEYAGWGVCRPNVRQTLEAGSVVIFFCAKCANPGNAETNYYF